MHMGHANKKSLICQVTETLTAKMSAGRSKHQDKADKATSEHIYSFDTLRSYIKQSCFFVRYCKKKHKCKTLQECRAFVNEFLQDNIDRGLSAYTIKTRVSALAKLYGCSSSDFIPTPARKRTNIARSRGVAVRDKHFSEKNNAELIAFCRGTGCRRNVLEKLKGGDLVHRSVLERELKELKAIERTRSLTGSEDMRLKMLKDTLQDQFPDVDYFIHHRKDKGGKERYAPIVGEHKQAIIDRMKSTPADRHVWSHVSDNADIHGYRRDYAKAIYDLYARPLDTLSRKQKYYCRGDLRGHIYDRKAMIKTSKALGHNRLCVVADHYLSN